MVFIGIGSLLNEMPLPAGLDSENWGILTADYPPPPWTGYAVASADLSDGKLEDGLLSAKFAV
jgi:hypothetical protein